MRILSCILLSIFVVMTIGCVTTRKDLDPLESDLHTLQRQIIKTQEDVTALRQDMGTESAKQLTTMKTDVETVRKTMADSQVQLDQNNRDISILSNRLDDYQERLSGIEQKINTTEQSVNQKIELAKAEIQQQIQELEKKIAAGMTSSIPPTTTPAYNNLTRNTPPTGIPPSEYVDPKQLYQIAEQDYLRGQYDLSIKSIKDYIQKFPEGAQIASARYLLAQSYLATQKFDESLTEFNAFVSSYPADEKVPAAMLKRAYIFQQQKKNTQYQAELKDLVKKYPLSPEAEQALEELKSIQ